MYARDSYEYTIRSSIGFTLNNLMWTALQSYRSPTFHYPERCLCVFKRFEHVSGKQMKTFVNSMKNNSAKTTKSGKSPELITLALSTLGTFDFGGKLLSAI